MTEDELSGAVRAVTLSEADCDDVRIVHEDGATLAVGLVPTVKEGVHLLLVHQDPKGVVTRLRVRGRHLVALVQTCGLLDEAS